MIKKPMDLGTIERNLEQGVYGVTLKTSAQKFATDVRLVWKNCMT